MHSHKPSRCRTIGLYVGSFLAVAALADCVRMGSFDLRHSTPANLAYVASEICASDTTCRLLAKRVAYWWTHPDAGGPR